MIGASIHMPEGWKSMPLSDLASFRTGPFGSTFHKSDYQSGGVPLINPSHIVDGEIVPDEQVAVGQELASQLSVFALRENDIVIGRRGDMGRCAVVRAHQAGFLCGTGSMIVRPRPGVSSELLQAFLASPKVIAKIEENSVGTTMINLNQGTLASLEILLPENQAGQQAIAAALSDADGVVACLEQVIAKKRLIKQGAMQDLLTARRRLPGFSGDWEPVNLARESHLKARIGWQGLTTSEYRDSGEYHLITGTEIIDGRVDWRRCVFVDKWRFDQDRNIQLRNADVLLTKDGTIGKVAQVRDLPGPAALNSGVFVIRPKSDAYDATFLFHVLRSSVFDTFLAKLTAGSTIVHLYQKDLVTFQFLAPSIEEQRAIAAALDDMDAEIQTFEARLAKARAVKDGMMQNLLTGRVRLV